MGATGSLPLIQLKAVSKSFVLDSGAELSVLQGVSFAVYPGETVALLGPSGAGKSTCLKLLSGLIKPSQGQVLSRDTTLAGVNRDVAMVFQNFALLPWATVFDNVALGLESLNLSRLELKAKARKVIDLVGLEGFEEAYPRELSGGMKQRVGLARALAMGRPVLCLDEPFSALDYLSSETLRSEVLKLWLDRSTATQSMVLVTHSISEAVFMANRILVMGTKPGVVRCEVKNDLSYPRDENTVEFKRMVSIVHDVMTQALIPDEPVLSPSVSGQAPAEVLQTIPDVQVGEMLGLLEILEDKGGRTGILQMSHSAGKDFGKTLFIVKAAEILDLVETPRNEIIITEMGRRLIHSDVNVRKRTLHELFKSLRLVQLVTERLKEGKDAALSSAEIIEFLAEKLPNENPESVFNTLVAWGRYAEYFGYNDNSKELYLDVGQETV